MKRYLLASPLCLSLALALALAHAEAGIPPRPSQRKIDASPALTQLASKGGGNPQAVPGKAFGESPRRTANRCIKADWLAGWSLLERHQGDKALSCLQ